MEYRSTITTCIKLFDLTAASNDWPVAGDWLEEQGHHLCHVFRARQYSLFDPGIPFFAKGPDYSSGFGDGSGTGSAYGYGGGVGSGRGDPQGTSYGEGSGSGNGPGSGSGAGNGPGAGDGFGGGE